MCLKSVSHERKWFSILSFIVILTIIRIPKLIFILKTQNYLFYLNVCRGKTQSSLEKLHTLYINKKLKNYTYKVMLYLYEILFFLCSVFDLETFYKK